MLRGNEAVQSDLTQQNNYTASERMETNRYALFFCKRAENEESRQYQEGAGKV